MSARAVAKHRGFEDILVEQGALDPTGATDVGVDPGRPVTLRLEMEHARIFGLEIE
jgi:hypothetical protein